MGELLLREALVRAEALGDLRQLTLTVLANQRTCQAPLCLAGIPRGYAREPAAVRIGDGHVDEIQMVRFLRREPRNGN